MSEERPGGEGDDWVSWANYVPDKGFVVCDIEPPPAVGTPEYHAWIEREKEPPT